MFSIDMGGCDIVLGADWLHTLGPVTMDLKELTMHFTKDNQTHNLKGLQRQIDVLSSFCDLRQLTIHLSKLRFIFSNV